MLNRDTHAAVSSSVQAHTQDADPLAGFIRAEIDGHVRWINPHYIVTYHRTRLDDRDMIVYELHDNRRITVQAPPEQ